MAVSGLGYSTLGPVSTRMGDCLQVGTPPWCVATYPGQLSLLYPVRWEMYWPECVDCLLHMGGTSK